MCCPAPFSLWKSFRRSRTQLRDGPETVRLHPGTGVHLHPGIAFILPRIPQACKIADICRGTLYRWLKEDPEFREAFEKSREEAAQLVEDEAARRAYEGVERPVYQGGEEVDAVREYSDTLLIFLLKGARPHKYRDNGRQEVVGANGAPLQPTTINIVAIPTPTPPPEPPTQT